jgi:hypothetical protein
MPRYCAILVVLFYKPKKIKFFRCDQYFSIFYGLQLFKVKLDLFPSQHMLKENHFFLENFIFGYVGKKFVMLELFQNVF